MLYLFGAAVVSTLLGIVITFLPVGLYDPYLHPVDELGALHLIRDTWGISAAEDQKLAGLIMWVPGCSVYFAVMLLELGRWFQDPRSRQARRFWPHCKRASGGAAWLMQEPKTRSLFSDLSSSEGR